MNTKISTIRSQFSALVSHPEIIYFDNAATTQKPQSVLDAVMRYHHHFCANPHRAQHDWATQSTQEVEKVREQVARFIGAEILIDGQENKGKKHAGKIFFTSGATHASELLAEAFLSRILAEKSTIICGSQDHDSLSKRWNSVAQKFHNECTFRKIPVNQEGFYSLESINNISDTIRENDSFQAGTVEQKSGSLNTIALLTHVHNVFGIEMGIKEARESIPKHIPIILDASQSVGHMPVSISELGVDALYFSGHKMFSFTGVGVLWVSDRYVDFFQEKNNEAGTLNVEGIISLGAAISFIESVGIPHIESQLLELTQYCIQKLRSIPDIEFLPGPAFCRCASGHGIVSFRKEGVSSAEVSDWLNTHHIFTRSGNHCAATSLTEDSVRISMHLYNTKDEIDSMCAVLREI